MEKRIASILSEYPDVISQNQFYRICGISKRKAKWLLENGHIPCQINDKKTHRFIIKLEDVINYLRKIEKDPQKHSPPIGLFNSNCRAKETSSSKQRNKFLYINKKHYAKYLMIL